VSRKVIGLEVLTLVLAIMLAFLVPFVPAHAGASTCRESFNLCCGSQLKEVTSIQIPSCTDNTNEYGEGEAYCRFLVIRNGVQERYLARAYTEVNQLALAATGKDSVHFRYYGVSCVLGLPPYVQATDCNITGNSATCMVLARAKDGTPVPFRTTVTIFSE
jgi:hypothetical protein